MCGAFLIFLKLIFLPCLVLTQLPLDLQLSCSSLFTSSNLCIDPGPSKCYTFSLFSDSYCGAGPNRECYDISTRSLRFCKDQYTLAQCYSLDTPPIKCIIEGYQCYDLDPLFDCINPNGDCDTNPCRDQNSNCLVDPLDSQYCKISVGGACLKVQTDTTICRFTSDATCKTQASQATLCRDSANYQCVDITSTDDACQNTDFTCSYLSLLPLQCKSTTNSCTTTSTNANNCRDVTNKKCIDTSVLANILKCQDVSVASLDCLDTSSLIRLCKDSSNSNACKYTDVNLNFCKNSQGFCKEQSTDILYCQQGADGICLDIQTDPLLNTICQDSSGDCFESAGSPSICKRNDNGVCADASDFTTLTVKLLCQNTDHYCQDTSLVANADICKTDSTGVCQDMAVNTSLCKLASNNNMCKDYTLIANYCKKVTDQTCIDVSTDINFCQTAILGQCDDLTINTAICQNINNKCQDLGDSIFDFCRNSDATCSTMSVTPLFCKLSPSQDCFTTATNQDYCRDNTNNICVDTTQLANSLICQDSSDLQNQCIDTSTLTRICKDSSDDNVCKFTDILLNFCKDSQGYCKDQTTENLYCKQISDGICFDVFTNPISSTICKDSAGDCFQSSGIPNVCQRTDNGVCVDTSDILTASVKFLCKNNDDFCKDTSLVINQSICQTKTIGKCQDLATNLAFCKLFSTSICKDYIAISFYCRDVSDQSCIDVSADVFFCKLNSGLCEDLRLNSGICKDINNKCQSVADNIYTHCQNADASCSIIGNFPLLCKLSPSQDCFTTLNNNNYCRDGITNICQDTSLVANAQICQDTTDSTTKCADISNLVRLCKDATDNNACAYTDNTSNYCQNAQGLCKNQVVESNLCQQAVDGYCFDVSINPKLSTVCQDSAGDCLDANNFPSICKNTIDGFCTQTDDFLTLNVQFICKNSDDMCYDTTSVTNAALCQSEMIGKCQDLSINTAYCKQPLSTVCRDHSTIANFCRMPSDYSCLDVSTDINFCKLDTGFCEDLRLNQGVCQDIISNQCRKVSDEVYTCRDTPGTCAFTDLDNNICKKKNSGVCFQTSFDPLFCKYKDGTCFDTRLQQNICIKPGTPNLQCGDAFTDNFLCKSSTSFCLDNSVDPTYCTDTFGQCQNSSSDINLCRLSETGFCYSSNLICKGPMNSCPQKTSLILCMDSIRGCYRFLKDEQCVSDLKSCVTMASVPKCRNQSDGQCQNYDNQICSDPSIGNFCQEIQIEDPVCRFINSIGGYQCTQILDSKFCKVENSLNCQDIEKEYQVCRNPTNLICTPIAASECRTSSNNFCVNLFIEKNYCRNESNNNCENIGLQMCRLSKSGYQCYQITDNDSMCVDETSKTCRDYQLQQPICKNPLDFVCFNHKNSALCKDPGTNYCRNVLEAECRRNQGLVCSAIKEKECIDQSNNFNCFLIEESNPSFCIKNRKLNDFSCESKSQTICCDFNSKDCLTYEGNQQICQLPNDNFQCGDININGFCRQTQTLNCIEPQLQFCTDSENYCVQDFIKEKFCRNNLLTNKIQCKQISRLDFYCQLLPNHDCINIENDNQYCKDNQTYRCRSLLNKECRDPITHLCRDIQKGECRDDLGICYRIKEGYFKCYSETDLSCVDLLVYQREFCARRLDFLCVDVIDSRTYCIDQISKYCTLIEKQECRVPELNTCKTEITDTNQCQNEMRNLQCLTTTSNREICKKIHRKQNTCLLGKKNCNKYIQIEEDPRTKRKKNLIEQNQTLVQKQIQDGSDQNTQVVINSELVTLLAFYSFFIQIVGAQPYLFLLFFQAGDLPPALYETLRFFAAFVQSPVAPYRYILDEYEFEHTFFPKTIIKYFGSQPSPQPFKKIAYTNLYFINSIFSFSQVIFFQILQFIFGKIQLKNQSLMGKIITALESKIYSLLETEMIFTVLFATIQIQKPSFEDSFTIISFILSILSVIYNIFLLQVVVVQKISKFNPMVPQESRDSQIKRNQFVTENYKKRRWNESPKVPQGQLFDHNYPIIRPLNYISHVLKILFISSVVLVQNQQSRLVMMPILLNIVFVITQLAFLVIGWTRARNHLQYFFITGFKIITKAVTELVNIVLLIQFLRIHFQNQHIDAIFTENEEDIEYYQNYNKTGYETIIILFIFLTLTIILDLTKIAETLIGLAQKPYGSFQTTEKVVDTQIQLSSKQKEENSNSLELSFSIFKDFYFFYRINTQQINISISIKELLEKSKIESTFETKKSEYFSLLKEYNESKTSATYMTIQLKEKLSFMSQDLEEMRVQILELSILRLVKNLYLYLNNFQMICNGDKVIISESIILLSILKNPWIFPDIYTQMNRYFMKDFQQSRLGPLIIHKEYSLDQIKDFLQTSRFYFPDQVYLLQKYDTSIQIMQLQFNQIYHLVYVSATSESHYLETKIKEWQLLYQQFLVAWFDEIMLKKQKKC